MTQTAFIALIYPAAKIIENEYKLPALAVCAQTALESGWGAHAPGNNYFGIKATASWTGAKQLLWTTEYVNGKAVKVQQWFRKYASPVDSLRDYAKLITTASRYATAAKTDDPYQYAREIAKAGYATDPNYANKIIANIEIVKKNSR